MITKTLAERLRDLYALATEDRERPGGKYPTMTELTLLSDCIAQAEREAQAGELSDEELQHRALRWSCDHDQSAFTYSQSLAAFGKHLRDHGYLRPSQAIGEPVNREEMIEKVARFFTEDGVYNPADSYYIVKRGSEAGDCARIIAGYLLDIMPDRPSPISTEARDRLIEAGQRMKETFGLYPGSGRDQAVIEAWDQALSALRR